MSGSFLKVTWSSRNIPLEPLGVFAKGKAAYQLGAKLLAMLEHQNIACTAVAYQDALCVLGEKEQLPWVDGVVYVGKDPLAFQLYVPTTMMPSIPMALLEKIVLQQANKMKTKLMEQKKQEMITAGKKQISEKLDSQNPAGTSAFLGEPPFVLLPQLHCVFSVQKASFIDLPKLRAWLTSGFGAQQEQENSFGENGSALFNQGERMIQVEKRSPLKKQLSSLEHQPVKNGKEKGIL